MTKYLVPVGTVISRVTADGQKEVITSSKKAVYASRDIIGSYPPGALVARTMVFRLPKSAKPWTTVVVCDSAVLRIHGDEEMVDLGPHILSGSVIV